MNFNETFDDAHQLAFSTIDYALFSMMLGIGASMGLYYGCYRQQNTVEAYVFGDKNMMVFPVIMSLIASHTSGIAIMSVPADIYRFGANYIWINLAVGLSSLFSYYIFIPVFLKLKVTSVYEYLHMRFDKKTRVLASLLYAITNFLYNPLVIYIPALAFSQASGWSIYVISPLVCLICIFYTAVGGLKAVVLADALQSFAILLAFFVVTISGIISAGGFFNVMDIAKTGQRLDIFEFNIDPTLRGSFWAYAIGATINWCESICVNQSTIQRLMAVPSYKKAKRVIIGNALGIMVIKCFATLLGLIIYAKYWNCDPALTKKITKSDQLVPYFVMDVAGNIPGISGIFIAGVFSAGLSTLSTTLNTLSATVYEDFVSSYMAKDITEKKVNFIMKMIVVILGVLSTLLVFVVQHLGGIFPLTVRSKGVAGGPLVGLFTLGVLFPNVHAKGAFCGGIFSLIFCSFVVIMNQWYRSSGQFYDIPKPLSTEGCNPVFNVTTSITKTLETSEQPLMIFRISDWYFMVLGTAVTIITAIIINCFVDKKNETPVHPDLLNPIVHRFLSKEQKKLQERGKYSAVNKETELEIVTNKNEINK